MYRGRTLTLYRRRLPHWEVEEGRYFVTICLSGCVPGDIAERIHSIAQRLKAREQWDNDAFHRKLFLEMEDWLHRNADRRELEQPDIAGVVMEAIRFRRERKQWRVLEYCLMPNHLHLFVQSLLGAEKGAMMDSLSLFKRWTGHQAMKLLGRHGEFWHNEWFDHWSRTEEEDARIRAYIRNNPVKAGLVKDYPDWPYGSWAE